MATVQHSMFCISITTFDEQGRLDEDAMHVHFRRMAEAGIGCYAGGSSPGEQYAMTPDEVDTVLGIAVQEMKGKVPCRSMGVEARTAKQMIEFTKIAEASGVEATQIYSMDLGHGNRPNEVEIETYLRTVLKEVKIPCVLSSHMAMGYQIPLPIIKRLADEFDQMIGVNYTNPSLADLIRLIDLMGDRLTIHTGGPMQALESLSWGATGFLTAESNYAPKLAASVINHWNAGEYTQAFDAYAKMIRAFTINRWGTSVRFNKACMSVLGLPGAHLRAPYLPIDDEGKREIAQKLQALGIPEIEGLKIQMP